MEYSLLNKKTVKENKELKQIQKQELKSHRKNRSRFPKLKLGKLVSLKGNETLLDLTETPEDSLSGKLPSFSSPKELISFLSKEKIYGLGGAAFDTSRKIQTVLKASSSSRFLLINAVACDPGLLHDGWLTRHHMKELEQGIRLLSGILSFKSIYFVTKDSLYPSLPSVQGVTVADRYPMGAEKILVKNLFGLSLSAKDNPANHGILVLNVQTIYSIYKAAACLLDNHPVSPAKFITAANLSNGDARILKVLPGQNVCSLLKQAFPGKFQNVMTAYCGGGLMSSDKVDSKSVITQKVNFICFGASTNYQAAVSCKGCGGCSRNCPMKIKVHKIVQAEEKFGIGFSEKLDPVLKEQALACLQCGACTYSCHAGKNIMEIMKKA